MKIAENYLENINYLVTNLIPLPVCLSHSFFPISFEKNSQNNKLSSVAIVMVNPNHIYACDTLDKLLLPKRIKYQKLLISPLDYQRLLRSYYRYLEESQIAKHLDNDSPNFQINSSSFNNLTNFNNKKLSKNLNLITPKKDDLVLGNKQHKPLNLGVLGGKEGLLSNLKSKNLITKVQGLHNAVNYENLGLNILIKTLEEESGILVWVAYSLLKKIHNETATTAILKYKNRLKQEELTDANLQGLNLKGIDLQRAKLNNVNFRGTQIDKNTKLPTKSLLIWKIVNQGLVGNYQLRELKLSLANLNNGKIRGVDFSYSIFHRVDFSQSNLSQVNFQESQLTDVNFQESKLIDLNFSKSHLKQVNFSKANLTGVDFKDVIFEQVVFSEVTMINVDMSYLDLSNLNLNFSGLDLRESKFIRTNLAGINLSGTNLYKVNLSGANLCNVNLNGANLNGAKLTLTTYNSYTKFPPDFNPQRFGAIFIDS
jgi:uncharacterized protein YjbI with pentapeptide repeats